MYKGHSIWDEEQDKYEKIKEETKTEVEYQDQKDYNAGDKSDVYNREKGGDKKKEIEASGVEREVEKEEKKYEKKDVSEEEIKAKAASEVHKEGKKDEGKGKKKAHKSIEDAINKAMREEKELIYVDD